MKQELSPQQLDPLGGVSARAVVELSVVVGILVSLALTLTSLEQFAHPLLEVLAFVSLALGGGWFIYASSPFRAPLRRSSHMIVTGFLLVAVLLNALAQVGSNDYLRDDWGPLGMAVVLFAMGAYRPAREVLVFTIISSVLVGALAWARADDFTAAAPPIVFGLLAAAPILGAGAGSAAFSASLVRTLLLWRERTNGIPTVVDSVGDLPAAHRSLVETEVAPFLQRIADAGSVSPADSSRARALSNELRALLVIDSERSWAADLAAGVVDSGQLADSLTTDQRSCLRALLAHINHSSVFDPNTLRLSFARDGWAGVCVIEVEYDRGSSPRLQLAPYIAVARSLFDPVHSVASGTTLRLTVGFEPTSR